MISLWEDHIETNLLGNKPISIIKTVSFVSHSGHLSSFKIFKNIKNQKGGFRPPFWRLKRTIFQQSYLKIIKNTKLWLQLLIQVNMIIYQFITYLGVKIYISNLFFTWKWYNINVTIIICQLSNIKKMNKDRNSDHNIFNRILQTSSAKSSKCGSSYQ